MLASHPRASIIHAAVPGRVRLRAPLLYRRDELVAPFVERLRASPEVQSLRVSATTGSVLVSFPKETPAARILDVVERVLAEVESWTADPTPATSRDGGGAGATLAEWASAARRALRREAKSAPADGLPEQAVESWHARSAVEVLELLGARAGGLSAEEAALRRTLYGPNALPTRHARSGLAIFAEQLKSTPVALLAGSAVISLATGGVGDAIAILAVVAVNATIGYVTESSAERTILALEQPVRRTARVTRDGGIVEIDSEELVPGDVVHLLSASFVPADVRLLEVSGLAVDESSLTGESLPVPKTAEPVSEIGAPLADRRSMAYRGTVITGGTGLGVVVATGAGTEIGRIQALAGAAERPQTPMEIQLGRLGTELAILSGAVCGGVFFLGWLRGYDVLTMVKTALSLAVAAVPEGLPTVATTTLALGVRRMRKLGVLVRRLDAIETLGAVQIICLDKTGTITENRMRVVEVAFGDRCFEATAEGLYERGARVSAAADPALASLLRVVALCSTATLEREDGGAVARGTPTEVALLQLAQGGGIDVEAERRRFPLRRTRERTEARMWMDTLHDDPSERGVFLALKGRPTDVLGLCDRVRDGAGERTLSDPERLHIASVNERLAGDGLRVLGFAEAHDADAVDARRLVWLGLVGMADPPRRGIGATLDAFHSAGVSTAMITGDQSGTAVAIGKKIGLTRDGTIELLDSTALADLAPDVLSALARRVQVFSRVSPAHKLRIVQALQAAGYVVAMTGDGVNDGPALKAADVGVAMGGAGTQVAREVADIVLSDDDLERMVTAIEQGRTIEDDIKKAVHFILATNLGEILLTATQVGFGLGSTLTPMQLLWINLLTDVLPELALAAQPPESRVLERPPRPKDAPMFSRRELGAIAIEGAVITSGAVGAFAWSAARGGGARASTIAFTTLTCAQLLHAVSARSTDHTIFDVGHPMAKNPLVPLSVAGTMGLQIAGSLLPSTRRLLGTVPLGLGDWAVVALGSVAPLLTNEALKLWRRTRVARATTTPEVIHV